MKKKLLIVGAGGHGAVVADIAGRVGIYDEIAFVAENQPKEGFAYPYLGKSACASELLDQYELFVAIGNSQVRQKLMDQLGEKGASFATLIAPGAYVASDVLIGEGTVVMPGTVINTGTTIGRGVIINTSSSVDHDCTVEDFCHISVGSHLCGTVYVGTHSWVGAGAVIINNCNVCADCMIGAGAVVIHDLIDSGTYVGVPARRN